MLNRNYIKTNKNPLEDYGHCFNEDTWKEFVTLKTNPEFEEKSEQGRENASKHKNPHRLGSRGYRGKRPTWEKMKKADLLKEYEDITSQRVMDFILSRLKMDSSGEYTLPDEFKPIADAIIEKDRQATQGTWIAEDGVDPMIAVLGPEHYGRVRGVGGNVGVRKGLKGLKKRKRNGIDQKNLDAIDQGMREEYDKKLAQTVERYDEQHRQYMESQKEREAKLEEKILQSVMQKLSKTGTTPHGSTVRKSSCGPPTCFNWVDSIQHPTPCNLMLSVGSTKFVCAKGRVFPRGDGVCHGTPLREGHMKVQVDKIMDGFSNIPLPVPMPSADMEKLEQAQMSFIQWPLNAIVLNQASKNTHLAPGHKSPPVVYNDQERHSQQPSLRSTSMLNTRPAHMQKEITQKPTNQDNEKPVPKEIGCRPIELQKLYTRMNSREEWINNGVGVDIMSGVFGSESLYILVSYDDVHQLLTKGLLDHTLITWFQLLMHMLLAEKAKNRCGFICPESIQADQCKRDKQRAINTLVATMLHKKELKFYLAPYIQSKHWILFLIWPQRRTVYILDPKGCEKSPKSYYIKSIMENAITRYNTEGGLCDTDISIPLTWHMVKFPWNNIKAFTLNELDQIACLWARYFISIQLDQ